MEIYEGRPGEVPLSFDFSFWMPVDEKCSAEDMRLPSSRVALAQRSVNLAISSRGLAALYSVNPRIMSRVLSEAIPMRGRLLHTGGGKTESQLYDPNGQVRI